MKAQDFTQTQFDTAEDKAKFARQFIKLVQGNFQEKDFPLWFYRKLSNTRGHIAHFDRAGFFATWFSTPVHKVQFIEHWLHGPIYGDPKFTYSDVERALEKWLQDGNWLAKQEDIMRSELLARKLAAEAPDPLAGQTSLDFVVKFKSQNTNSFGLHQYIMVGRNGWAYKVHRSLCQPWELEQIVRVPLVSRLRADGQRRLDVAWEQMGVEIPSRLTPDFPADKLKEVWDHAGKHSPCAL